MFDVFLKIGSSFDWISPVAAEVQDALNGPVHTFTIPEDGGWSGHEINGLLKRHGVRTWGLMAVNDTIMVSVREAQAKWASHVLQREGVPVENPVGEPQAAGKQRQPSKPAADPLTSFFDTIESWLG